MKDLTRKDIDAYIDYGTRPSGFLEAVLCNDLIRAFRLADEQNATDIFDVVRYCHNHVPVGAWGSLDKFRGWVKHRGKQQYDQARL